MLLPNYVQLRELRVEPLNISLRWLLVIPFVLQTVGATALVGYLSYRSGQQAVENLANQLLRQTSERVIDRLSSYFQTPQNIVAANHLAVEQRTLDLNNREQLRRHLWQQMILNRSIPSIIFWSEQGDGIGYGRISSQQEQNFIREVIGKKFPIGKVYLYKIIPKQRQYYLADSQGKPQKLVYTFKDDFRKLTWYRQVKAVGKQHWTPVFVGRVLPSLQIMAVTPANNATGKNQGFFTSGYFLAEISTFLNRLRFSPKGKIFIIERSGNLIATSVLSEATGTRLVKGKPDTPNGTLRERLPAVNSQDEVTRKVSQKLLQQFGSFYNLKDTKQLSLQVNHHQDFVQVTPFKDKYGLDWLVVTVIPESDFMTEIQNNTRTTILLCLLTLSMAIASGLTIANRFATRITRLNRVSQKLAVGDLTQRLPADSLIIEVRELGQSFNLMADQLEQSFERIKIALEESQEKFTTVFRTSPDPIAIVTTTEGRFIEVNARMCKFYGYSREEMIGKTAIELGLWINLVERQRFKELLEQGAVYNFETTTQIKSGETRVMLLSGERCNLEGQDVTVVVIKDISDRKQAEEVLRISEEQRRLAIDLNKFGSFDWNPIADRATWNDNCFQLFGYIPGEVTPSYAAWRDRVHPEDIGWLEATLSDRQATKADYEVEYRIVHPNNSVHWLSMRARTIFNESGQAVRILGILADITDRKAAEIALECYERIVSATADGIALVDRNYRYQIVNQTYLYWHDKPKSEIVGHLLSDVLGQEIFETMIKPHFDRCLTGQTIENTDWFELPSIERQFLSVTYSPYVGVDGFDLNSAEGSISGVVLSLRNITPLKLAELALGQSERKFRGAFDTISAGMALISPAGGFLEVNTALCQILSYSESELLKLRLEDIEHPDDRQADLNWIEPIFSGELSAYQAEKRFLSKQGQIIWGLMNLALMRNVQGIPLYLIVQIVNISNRKQMEAELRRTEQWLNQYSRLSPSMIYTVVQEPDRRVWFEYMSSAVETILEVSSTQVLEDAQVLFNQIHPDDSAAYGEAVLKSIENLELFFFEWRVITPSGKVKWLQAKSQPERRSNGTIAWYGVVQDITERKQAEEALRLSEERWQLAIQGANDGIWDHNLITNENFLSPRCLEILGCSFEEVSTFDKWTERIYSEDRPVMQKTLEKYLNRQIPLYVAEYRIRCHDGSYKWILSRGQAVWNEQGIPFRMIGSITDITDRHQLDAMKDEFVAMVSHELRTPLTSIQGSLSLLECGVLKDKPDRSQQMLQIALQSTERLVRLVNDILNLQRLDSGRVPLVKEICQVNYLIELAVESVRAIADQAQLTLESTPLDASVWASSDEIIQTLINLLGNAIKFSLPQTTISVKAEVTKNLDSRILAKFPDLKDTILKNCILFSITDQGRGIPPDKLESIFGRFQQVNSADSREKGGTGLGLAICKNIVQRHQGLIWVESVMGQGSTFYFTLPMGD